MSHPSRYPINLFVKIFFNYFCLAIVGIGAVVALLMALWATFPTIVGLDLTLNEGQVKAITVLSLWMITIMLLSLSVFLANVFPIVRVSQDGLYVQVFLFWWTFVPWGDIEAIHPTLLGRIVHSSYIVVLKRLTLSRWFWIRPFNVKLGFQITKQTEKMDDLVQVIKGKVNRNS